MTNNSLDLAKSIYNKLSNGTHVSVSELKNILFADKLKPYVAFIDSPDFNKLIQCFDFNGDSKVNVDDFDYFKDNITDLNIFLKISNLASLAVTSFKNLKNIGVPKMDASVETQQAIVRILIYIMLLVISLNQDSFVKWAQGKNDTNQTNGEILYFALEALILYVDNAQKLGAFVKEAFYFFKENCNCCSSTQQENPSTPAGVTAEMNSLTAQVRKLVKK